MQGKAIQWPGQQNFRSAPVVLVNRTNGQLNKGDVIAIDLTNTEAESIASNILRNAVLPAAGNLDGLIGVVTTETTVEDNDPFEAVFFGPVLAKVDGVTIDVLGGDKLIVTAGARTLTRSDATTDIVVALAVEANAGVAALKLVFLKGSSTTPGTDEA